MEDYLVGGRPRSLGLLGERSVIALTSSSNDV
jgi:hypothetical protein